jgi:nephrocystin-3
VDVTVKNNKLVVYTKDLQMSAFALLDASFRDDAKSALEQKSEKELKQKLSDSLEPLTRTQIRKKMEIVGWSQNLLQNASGEVGLVCGQGLH